MRIDWGWCVLRLFCRRMAGLGRTVFPEEIVGASFVVVSVMGHLPVLLE